MTVSFQLVTAVSTDTPKSNYVDVGRHVIVQANENGWREAKCEDLKRSFAQCHISLMIIIIIIIKCMCSRCRRDDIHVCFAYASPQRMPHMYDHKTVSLKYII